MRKNKGLFFVVATLLAVTCLLVSCNSEVSDNASGDKGLAYITFDGGNSKRITQNTITEAYELVDINELYWVYSATKADLGGASGQTTAARVNNTTGLSGVIGGFSKGLWNFTLTGWKYDGEGGDPSTDVPTDSEHTNYEKIFVGSASGILLNTGTQSNPDPINVNVSFVPGGNGTLIIDSDFIFQWQSDSAGSSTAVGNALQLRITDITTSTSAEVGTIELTRGTQNSEVYYSFASDKSYDQTHGNHVYKFEVIENATIDNEQVTLIYAIYPEVEAMIYSGQTTRITAEMLEGEFAAGQFNAIIESVDTQTVTASVPVTFTSSYTPASATSGNVDASAITTVEFEADALAATGEDESYKLTVAVSDFATAQSKFVVLDGTSAASLDLDLKKYTGSSAGESITTFAEGKSAVITSYIAKGLTGVNVVYNGENVAGYSVDAGNGPITDSTTIPAMELSSDSGLGYNPATGYLSFKTNHFSEYYVSANAVEAINVRTNKVGTLSDTLNSSDLSDGDTVMLLKDVTYDSGSIEITKGITLEGNGHTITNTRAKSGSDLNGNKPGRDAAVYLNNAGKTVSINNLNISTTKIGFIYVGTNDTSGTKADGGTINISNCDFRTAGDRYGFFVNNYVNNLTVNINGSTLLGYAAIYSKSQHSAYNISNSTLYGYNTTSTAPSNGFGTVVIDAQTETTSPEDVPDDQGCYNTVVIDNCTIYAQSDSTNVELWLCLQYAANHNTVTVTDTHMYPAPSGTEEITDYGWEYSRFDGADDNANGAKATNTVTVNGVQQEGFPSNHA